MNSFIAVNHIPCTGCRTCEVVCSLYHSGECRPEKSAIRVIRRERDGLVFCLPLVCQQCEPAPCIDACPTGALSRDKEKGSLAVKEEDCTGCGLCADACPIGCIPVDTDSRLLTGCDLCGGQPQCVPLCHAHCLKEVDRKDESHSQSTANLVSVLKQEGLKDRIPGKKAER